jgi:hypothetical protein
MWKVDRGSQIGVTTDMYVDALAWTVSEMGKKTFLLKNMESGGGNGLRYRLDGLVSFGGITTELVPETVLGGGEVAEFHYDRQWAKLILQVKAAVAGSQAGWRVDYEGQGA